MSQFLNGGLGFSWNYNSSPDHRDQSFWRKRQLQKVDCRTSHSCWVPSPPQTHHSLAPVPKSPRILKAKLGNPKCWKELFQGNARVPAHRTGSAGPGIPLDTGTFEMFHQNISLRWSKFRQSMKLERKEGVSKDVLKFETCKVSRTKKQPAPT